MKRNIQIAGLAIWLMAVIVFLAKGEEVLPLPIPTTTTTTQPVIDLNTLRRSLVVVETDKESSSGFVIEIGGKRYVMTNKHVIEATKKIRLRLVDGQELIPKEMETAVGIDAARITFESQGVEPAPLTLASNLPSIGNSIKIFGNSGGGGGFSDLKGNIIAIGPDNIEISGGFVRSNSGGPILDEVGNVVGVATFTMRKPPAEAVLARNAPDAEWVRQDSSSDGVQRYGVRLTEHIKWEPVTFEAFYQQTKQLYASVIDFDALRRSLVVIERDDGGAGSGFIVDMGGKRYIITNRHVIDASRKIKIRLVDGQELIPKALEIAAELDAARITFETKGADPTPLTRAANLPSLGTSINIYGNSGGVGTVTEIKGKILSIGPDNIEVDASFIGGNSGSPILDQAGKVVGIATFFRQDPGADWVTSGTRFGETRRFGVRLTEEIKWVSVSFDVFYAQTQLLADSHSYLLKVVSVMSYWIGGNSAGYYNGGRIIKNSECQKWELRIKNLIKAYKAYWDAKAKHVQQYNARSMREGRVAGKDTIPPSMTVNSTKITLIKFFKDLPFAPKDSLQKTIWLTPSLARESQACINFMEWLYAQIVNLLNGELYFFWDKPNATVIIL